MKILKLVSRGKELIYDTLLEKIEVARFELFYFNLLIRLIDFKEHANFEVIFDL